MTLLAIDHVQLGMPAGGEPAARTFYGGVLGLAEVAKPPQLAGRGGVELVAAADAGFSLR
jgi:catechol 2,3-dioxygenase-like lactoylglutathione lyase family enzyme